MSCDDNDDEEPKTSANSLTDGVIEAVCMSVNSKGETGVSIEVDSKFA